MVEGHRLLLRGDEGREGRGMGGERPGGGRVLGSRGFQQKKRDAQGVTICSSGFLSMRALSSSQAGIDSLAAHSSAMEIFFFLRLPRSFSCYQRWARCREGSWRRIDEARRRFERRGRATTRFARRNAPRKEKILWNLLLMSPVRSKTGGAGHGHSFFRRQGDGLRREEETREEGREKRQQVQKRALIVPGQVNYLGDPPLRVALGSRVALGAGRHGVPTEWKVPRRWAPSGVDSRTVREA